MIISGSTQGYSHISCFGESGSDMNIAKTPTYGSRSSELDIQTTEENAVWKIRLDYCVDKQNRKDSETTETEKGKGGLFTRSFCKQRTEIYSVKAQK